MAPQGNEGYQSGSSQSEKRTTTNRVRGDAGLTPSTGRGEHTAKSRGFSKWGKANARDKAVDSNRNGNLVNNDVHIKGCNNLFILFSNVDTFSTNKQIKLKERLQLMEQTPQIIALQEVKPKNCRYEKFIEEYKLDGYDIIEHNLSAKEGRGLLLYVRDDISAIL